MSSQQSTASKVIVHQAAGSAWWPGLSLLLVGDNRWPEGFVGSPSEAQGQTLVALRTIVGSGEMVLRREETAEQHTLSLTPGSLALFHEARVEEYRTTQGTWQTRWFDFVCHDEDALPLGQVFATTLDDQEQAIFEQMQQAICSDSLATRKVATCQFSLQLAKWLESVQLDLPPRDDGTIAVEAAIAIMRDNLHQIMSIDAIAADIGLSPQAMRKQFATVVGISPKKFYTRLRMIKACELLDSGSSVSETSERLGFSSPFHFSRAFGAFYQVPPQTKKNRPGS